MSNARGFRADIQALRALAVAAVVANHAWPDALPGGYIGVDVFFVISGFLITSHLLRPPPTTFRDVVQFWGRRVRRLLPAALTVLAVVLVASRAFGLTTMWGTTARSTIAAASYWINWQLATDAVDYLRGDDIPTPVQHYWSLSVEEQFYFVWPILLLTIGWLTRKRFQVAVPIALGVVSAGSLAASIYLTHTNPAAAYFVTHTRAWEFAAGGLLAVVSTGSTNKGILPRWASWFGWAGIATASILYTADTPFPGWTALLPVVATVVVIAAKDQNPLIRLRPVTWLGDISYSLYLWHWPALIFLPLTLPEAPARLLPFLAVAASLILAGLTKTLVEDPILGRGRLALPIFRLRWLFPTAALAMTLVIGMASLQQWELRHRAHVALERQEALATSLPAVVAVRNSEQQELVQALRSFDLLGYGLCHGAAAFAPGNSCPPSEYDRLFVSADVAFTNRDGWQTNGCQVNVAKNPQPADCTVTSGRAHVVVLGNSHATHVFTPLIAVAEKRDWTLTLDSASGCEPGVRFQDSKPTDGCAVWWQQTYDSLKTWHADLIVVSNLTFRATPELVEPVLRKLAALGSSVVVIRDNPSSTSASVTDAASKADDVPTCVAAHPADMDACTLTLHPDPWFDAAQRLHTEGLAVSGVDLSDLMCREGTCYGVVGNTIVLLDDSHYTETFATTLEPFLDQRLEATGLLP